jgi:hypothetical protein
MSYAAHGAVHDTALPPRLKIVCHALAGFLNEATGQLNPSMSAIALNCGVSESQARRLVHELIGLGYLSVLANHDGGYAQNSRQYQLHLGRLPLLQKRGASAPIGTPSTSATPCADATPSASATPCTHARDPLHQCAPPLAPVRVTPSASDTQTKKEPRKNQEEKQEERGRARTTPSNTLPCPDDVDPQTWADWFALRKKKNAPVTATVVNGARSEADKAGMPLNAFLEVWCLRGSQGLQADWLKPSESARGKAAPQMTFEERDNLNTRKRVAEMSGRSVDRTGLSRAQLAELQLERQISVGEDGLPEFSGMGATARLGNQRAAIAQAVDVDFDDERIPF